jgi:simple sugar transport system ATP-binding protein
MAEMMVGGTLRTPARAPSPGGDVVLEVQSLSAPSPRLHGTALKGVTFSVSKGEVLGIGGVAGNGQDELLLALSGEMRVTPGMVRLKGEPIGRARPSERRALGLLCAPEERNGHASAPDMSLTENAFLTGRVREGLARGGFVNWTSARDFAERIIARFDVRTPGPGSTARSLSGGNLQKFVIGREIMQRPEVLVVNQPTWGVDASAAAAIRQALLDLASHGAAVVVVSQDLDELMEISDRYAALNEGRLSAARPARGLTVEEIGLMLGGAHGMEVAHVH